MGVTRDLAEESRARPLAQGTENLRANTANCLILTQSRGERLHSGRLFCNAHSSVNTILPDAKMTYRLSLLERLSSQFLRPVRIPRS